MEIVDYDEIKKILNKFLPIELCEIIINKLTTYCYICKNKYAEKEYNNKCKKCYNLLFNLKYAERITDMKF